MIQIIVVCLIVGMALIMTIRWLRKKLHGTSSDCCSSRRSCCCNTAAGVGTGAKSPKSGDGRCSNGFPNIQ